LFPQEYKTKKETYCPRVTGNAKIVYNCLLSMSTAVTARTTKWIPEVRWGNARICPS